MAAICSAAPARGGSRHDRRRNARVRWIEWTAKKVAMLDDQFRRGSSEGDYCVSRGLGRIGHAIA